MSDLREELAREIAQHFDAAPDSDAVQAAVDSVIEVYAKHGIQKAETP